LSEDTHPNEHLEWRFYGRRAGRKLNTLRQKVINDSLPPIKIKDDILHSDGNLSPANLFQLSATKTVFEIGFGNGERLAEMMRRHPDNNYIAAEAFINGVSAFLIEGGVADAKNLRVRPDDAIPLVQSLNDSCIDELYILNPDPWHKTRHHKRRIVNEGNLDEFTRILKPNGTLILSTDVPDLSEWMITHSARHENLNWRANSKFDWLVPPENWIKTRYETKGAKGAANMHYMIFDCIK